MLTPSGGALNTTPLPEDSMSELLDRINDIRKTCRPRSAFTLERGGQPRRLFVEQWETWEDARAALVEARTADRSFMYDDYGEGGGTTFIPTSVLTRHLPDDEG
jgi:hypothetical protein